MLKNKEGKQQIICIVGPTASGKTELSIELAKKLSAEIISIDSMQIYKELDVGTAKVTREQMQGIPHHMIDICDIDEKYSVAQFKTMVYNIIDELNKNDKNVILVGGTGLYLSAIIYDMQFHDMEIDEDYRNSLYKLAKENSNEYVHSLLQEVDSEAAQKIHPNNLKRVIRVLEYAKYIDKNMSEHLEAEKDRIAKNENLKYDFRVFCIDIERQILYKRINQRVDEMVNEGLLLEAKKIYEKRLSNEYTCMQAIGYKELFEYFSGESTLQECIELIKRNSRRYAKRQLTWFKGMENINWLNGLDDKESLIENIMNNIANT